MSFSFVKWKLVGTCCIFGRKIHSWNVMFFGSDGFSLKSLEKLRENLGPEQLISKLEVVTTVGQKLNAVGEYCTKNSMPITKWPINNLLNHDFHFGVVASFGHLIPKQLINAFPLGILNVHASLLPRWRGAAPIIHAIINGDKETGITIMRIKPHHFDTGDIVYQESCAIGDDELMTSLHKRLSIIGAECLIKTIRRLPDCLEHAKPQPEDSNLITHAPRITRTACIVRWELLTASEIYDLHRGLHGISDLLTYWHSLLLKLGPVHVKPPQEIMLLECREMNAPGDVHYCKGSNVLYIRCKGDTWIYVTSVKVGGRKMSPIDFYNGYLSKVPLGKRYFSCQ